MKVFKDLEFKELGGSRIGAFERFSNDFAISVVAGPHAYSTPRESNKDSDFFSEFEVAVFAPNGDFTREFFPEDHTNDAVMGWQERGQINALMLLIQSKK